MQYDNGKKDPKKGLKGSGRVPVGVFVDHAKMGAGVIPELTKKLKTDIQRRCTNGYTRRMERNKRDRRKILSK